MKKLLLIVAALALTVGVANATEVFYGNTQWSQAEFVDHIATGTYDQGYYMWSNDEAKTSWSLRWINDVDSIWAGLIEAESEYGGTYVKSVDTIHWPSYSASTAADLDTYIDSLPADYVTNSFFWEPNGLFFNATTDAGEWDGFDFTVAVDPDDPGYVAGEQTYFEFELAGSMFDDIIGPYSEDDFPAINMFVGADLSLPLSEFTKIDNYRYVFENVDGQYSNAQEFMVAAPVPEPGTFLLLGSGLAGLVVYRRRQKRS